jgi:hypothetical protein
MFIYYKHCIYRSKFLPMARKSFSNIPYPREYLENRLEKLERDARVTKRQVSNSYIMLHLGVIITK